MNTAQDRFYNTDLDKALKAKGITTIIMVGWKVSGSVAYSSVGATVRDYTVVVPVDTTAAATDYEQIIGFYQHIESAQWQHDEPAFEAKSPNAEPHGHDHLPIRDHQPAADRNAWARRAKGAPLPTLHLNQHVTRSVGEHDGEEDPPSMRARR